MDEYECMSLLDMTPYRIQIQDSYPQKKDIEAQQPVVSQVSSNNGLISAPPDGFFDFTAFPLPMFDLPDINFEDPFQPKPVPVENKDKKITFKCKVVPARRTVRHCGEFMVERLRHSYHRKMMKHIYQRFL